MRRLLLPIFLLALLAVPAVAQAGYQAVINDCTNPDHAEQLTKQYTAKEYNDALKHLPSDVREYTGCYDVILNARDKAAAGGGTSTGTGGGTGTSTGGDTGGAGTGTTSATTPGATGTATSGGATAAPAVTGSVDPLATATDADRTALVETLNAGGAPVQVGAAMITPGDPGATTSAIGDLPTPLLVLLGLLLVGGAAGLALLVKNLVLRRSSS
jgi:hypothetical protein